MDEQTARQYLTPVFGNIELARITPQKVAEWFYSLAEKGLAPATCNRILAVFRAICAQATTLGLTAVDAALFRYVKAHKFRIFKQHILTTGEARELLRHLKKEKKLAAYAPRLLILTGASKGEILSARWEDYDPFHHMLTVKSRNGSKKNLRLGPYSAAILEGLPRTCLSPWIFPGRDKNKHQNDVFFSGMPSERIAAWLISGSRISVIIIKIGRKTNSGYSISSAEEKMEQIR